MTEFVPFIQQIGVFSHLLNLEGEVPVTNDTFEESRLWPVMPEPLSDSKRMEISFFCFHSKWPMAHGSHEEECRIEF
jgi:hypothetical protein